MPENSQESRFKRNVIILTSWADVSREFDQFPKQMWRRDETGQAYQEGWIFRGHKKQSYRLEPSIERVYPFLGWEEAEYKIVHEFKSKARMRMDPAQLPQPDDRLGWLATIQHYGGPTRLLDFTYSAYVALYFALRNREKGESEFAEVWAIDESALRRQAMKMNNEVDQKIRAQKGHSIKGHRVSSCPEDAISSLQQVQGEDQRWSALIGNALDPCGTRRNHFNRNGFVAVARPTLHNPRLSSQQGLFVFNGAVDPVFEESLELMMQEVNHQWYKRFRIPEEMLEGIEKQLFQLNIHDLSLFPDINGLAGFVRQKIRLQW